MTTIMDSYRHFMETKSDPRTGDWWMASGPAPLITVLISYVYFSVSVGPRYMRDKKPYDLKYVMIVYNAVQVLLSAYLVHEGLMGGWMGEYSFTCQPVDYSNSPTGKRMAAAVWWYFFAKVVELLDTVFFVLRKKNNQISFLHVYHHTLMPICAFIGVKFLPGGHGTLLGVINSFIHIIMYTYYLLAGLGPQYQKFLWWKKYVTMLQLVQFMIIFVHSAQLLPSTCNYPKFIAVLLTINALFFIYLFGSFYVRTYRKESKRKINEKEKTEGEITVSNGNGSIKEAISSNGTNTSKKVQHMVESSIHYAPSELHDKSKEQ